MSITGFGNTNKTLTGVVDSISDTATISTLTADSLQVNTVASFNCSPNVTAGQSYMISGNPVLTSSSLGGSVVSSSLNSVGRLNSLDVSGNAIIAGNLSVSGSLTNSVISQLISNTSSLTTDSSGLHVASTLYTKAVNLSGLVVLPNTKGSATLANCYTVGTEITTTVTFPNFSFTSDTQNGYSLSASSNPGTAYYGWGTANGVYWSTSTLSYAPGGSAFSTYYITHSTGVSYGEFLSMACPSSTVLTNVSFYNTDGNMSGQTSKSVSIFGQQQPSGTIYLLGSLTMPGAAPAVGTYTFSVSTSIPCCNYYFQITQESNWSGAGVNLNAFMTKIVLTGYPVTNANNQSVYVPQSLEVGRTLIPSSLPGQQLTVNGNATVNADMSVGGVLTVISHVFRKVYAFEAIAGGGTVPANYCYCGYGTVTYLVDPYEMFTAANGFQAPRAGWYHVSFNCRPADGNATLAMTPRVIDSTGSTTIKSYTSMFIPSDGSASYRRSLCWTETIYMGTGNWWQPICAYTVTTYGWSFSAVYVGE